MFLSEVPLYGRNYKSVPLCQTHDSKTLADSSFCPVLPGRYRVISLTRNRTTLGPCRRTMPRGLWWSEGGDV